MDTYLQEEEAVRANFFKELDASNCVCGRIDGEKRLKACDRSDISNAVLLEVQVFEVGIGLELLAEILDGRVRLLHRQGHERVGTAI